LKSIKDKSIENNIKFEAKISSWKAKFKNPLGILIKHIPKNDSTEKAYYQKYYSKKDIENGLKNNKFYKGILTIPEKFDSEDSYIIINDSMDKVFIKSIEFRNRALDEDEVVIELLENNDEKIGKKNKNKIYNKINFYVQNLI